MHNCFIIVNRCLLSRDSIVHTHHVSRFPLRQEKNFAAGSGNGSAVRIIKAISRVTTIATGVYNSISIS